MLPSLGKVYKTEGSFLKNKDTAGKQKRDFPHFFSDTLNNDLPAWSPQLIGIQSSKEQQNWHRWDICIVVWTFYKALNKHAPTKTLSTRGGGETLLYMGFMGMFRRGGYGFQAVYSGIGYINQRVWV